MFVIKEFQTTCLILLTDWAKDNVPYLLATAANRSRIKRESEYNIVLSLTNIFFQKTNFIWSILSITNYYYETKITNLTWRKPPKGLKGTARKCMYARRRISCRPKSAEIRGITTGGISVYIPPLKCFYVVVLSPWPTYTHPNQIPGYASGENNDLSGLCWTYGTNSTDDTAERSPHKLRCE